jgi:hypothetical protein
MCRRGKKMEENDGLGKGTWLFSEFSPMISGTIERKVL